MNLFASIYERETRAVRLYTDNSLGPLARESPSINNVQTVLTEKFKKKYISQYVVWRLHFEPKEPNFFLQHFSNWLSTNFIFAV